MRHTKQSTESNVCGIQRRLIPQPLGLGRFSLVGLTITTVGVPRAQLVRPSDEGEDDGHDRRLRELVATIPPEVRAVMLDVLTADEERRAKEIGNLRAPGRVDFTEVVVRCAAFGTTLPDADQAMKFPYASAITRARRRSLNTTS